MSRKHLLAATLLAAPFALSGLAKAQPVTGLYIGAGAGANFMQTTRSFSASASGQTTFFAEGDTRSYDPGYAIVGSVGYGLGNGLRFEIEGDYRHNDASRTQSVPGLFTGYTDKYGPMVNALFDLDVRSPYVFPYVGAGAGYSWVEQHGTRLTGSVLSTGQGTEGSFAYQAIAGLSFPIPPVIGLSLTLEYRYFALAGNRTFEDTNVSPAGVTRASVTTKDNYNHSLMLGLRYAFNVAPPPPPAVAVATPAAPQAARTYLVFFDWDRADLTDRARQIIAEAAQATTRVQVTRIEVNGYTDRSGTARYNQGLSIRRAQNVANELVRLGVPRQSIAVQGFGENNPLVPTADGVREPQNRRVEIILR